MTWSNEAATSHLMALQADAVGAKTASKRIAMLFLAAGCINLACFPCYPQVAIYKADLHLMSFDQKSSRYTSQAWMVHDSACRLQVAAKCGVLCGSMCMCTGWCYLDFSTSETLPSASRGKTGVTRSVRSSTARSVSILEFRQIAGCRHAQMQEQHSDIVG